MSYTSYWKGSSGKSQKPPKNEPSASTNIPQNPTDNSWVLMDTDATPPPTYPDAGPQAEPEEQSTRPSTSDATQTPLVRFRLYCQSRGMKLKRPAQEEDLPEVAIA